MRFQPGQSGNPAGRPPGSRNKKTLEVEAMLAERAEATAKGILDRADRGEPAAMRLCMDRIAPTGANRPIAIELPAVETPDDVMAATRVVMGALTAGEISARETVSLLTVVERLARLAERVQQMRERHEVWWGAGQSDASAKEAARAALAAVLKEEGIDAPDLFSPVDSDAAVDAEPLYSPVNSARAPRDKGAVGDAAPGEAEPDGLYFPVNSAAETPAEATTAPNVPASGGGTAAGILRGRRSALMTSAASKALLIHETPVDPRCYVTEQTWLAAMLKNEAPGAMRCGAA